MNKYKYYKTKYKRLSPGDIFVLVDDELTIYTPIGQHSTASLDYIKNDCKEISLETYLKVSEGIYTPEEYIGKE
jgi:hypothetical protein